MSGHRYLGLGLFVVVAVAGCSEVRGRRKIQEGNRFYRDGQYKEAVAAFEEAERLVPDFWVLWLNKGYTCRQQIIPGAKTPENVAAGKCALGAFKRLQELKPEDARGELLYIQTLFDTDEFEALAKMYEGRIQKNPKDIDSVTGLIQVYTKWNKIEEALEWYTKKAEMQAQNPESQYAVGVFLWQELMQKGGGPDKQGFDPRPEPGKVKMAPAFGGGDIMSQQRVDYADKGVEYLKKALVLRPKYPEAMTYINLLYRQKALAFFDQPDEWQKAVNEATGWMIKALEAQNKPVPEALRKGLVVSQQLPSQVTDESVEQAGDAQGAAKKGGKPGKGGKKPKKGKRKK
jgi:tetratricopeptide (TPR) repeat protein